MADTLTREQADAGRLEGARDFLVSTRTEMRKVTWPTRDELIEATRQIIILSVVLGLVIGFLDFALQKLLVDGVAALAR